MRRATAVAATASGGATTAPRAIAADNGMPISHQVTSPTPAAVKMTSPTDSSPMTFLFAPRSTSEVRIAAAYRRGGRMPRRISSGPTWTSGAIGTNEMRIPTAVRTRGAETL